MTIGDRLKEERQRVGLSQPALAAIVSASKSAVISWEKGASAPTAPALAEMAQAGFDALYILTARRSSSDPDTAIRSIEDDLAQIRRDILDPLHDFDGSESRAGYEAGKLEIVARRLRTYLDHDAALMTPRQAEETASLLEIVTDPARVTAYRAADFAQERKRREHMRDSLAGWFGADAPAPAGTAMNILTTLTLDYGAPVKLLVELVHELREDGARLAASRT